MAIKTLNPYIMLNGRAAEAVALYQEALGATLPGPIMRYGDVPGQHTPPEVAQRVMHARLEVGGLVLMVSDARPDHPVVTGSHLNVAIEFDDLAQAQRAFALLAHGGAVTTPLTEMFWGATFGALDDRFGVSWMVSAPKAGGA